MGCLHYLQIIIVICMCSAQRVCVRVCSSACVKFSLFPRCLTLTLVYTDIQTGDEFSQVIF